MPKLIRFLLIITSLHLVLFSLLRVAFWQYFNNPNDPLSLSDLGSAFYLGVKFDLQLSLAVILPIFIFGNIRILNPFHSGGMRFFWLVYFFLIMAGILIIYSGNFGHYGYLGKSIDATMLRFFENLEISTQMVWETYPVIEWSLGLIAFLFLYLFLLNRLIIRNNYQVDTPRSILHKIIISLVFTSLLLFGLFGKISYYPLRWSDAFFSPHYFVPAVTSNPVLYFLNTLKNRTLNYSDTETRKYYDTMAKYLNVDKPNKETLSFIRKTDLSNSKPSILKTKRKYNVVMVFLESFSAFKSGLYNNPLNPTPNIDSLARKGYFFKRFYTPSTGTARSVFTALTGIPDVEPKKTSTRNPLIVDQHLIINSFEAYQKLYFLGGSASWGNIRGLLSKNITGLKLYEEGSYQSPRVDVWGIADHDLFKEANNVLKDLDPEIPFFAVIQTSGNHRPYTIPENVPNFTLDNSNDDKLTNSGFLNNGEYNSYRFLDHSIGLFIEKAKKEKYFDNTLFVFFGDHGVAGTGQHIKPSYSQLGLMNLHVPLIFYAPKLITTPKQFNKVASEVDLMPTIAGLLKQPYTNSTLGRDLFDPQFDKSRYAFTVSHGATQRIGLIGSKYYYQMDESGKNASLHDLDKQSARTDVSKNNKARKKHMDKLLRTINTSVNYMRYHNNKSKIKSK